LTLDITDNHKPVLKFSEGGKEKGRLTPGIGEGSPMLQVYDRVGRERVMFGIPKTGAPALRLPDEHDQILKRLP